MYRRGRSCASEADEDADEEPDPEDEDPPVLVLLLPLPLLLEGGAEVVGEDEGGTEVVGGANATRGSYSTTANLFTRVIGSVSFIVPLLLKQAAAARADTRRERTRMVILRVGEKDLGCSLKWTSLRGSREGGVL